MVFAFEVGGITLEVGPADTALVRLVAVTSGVLEARPREIGAEWEGRRVARGDWLSLCRGPAAQRPEARAYFNHVFDALADHGTGRRGVRPRRASRAGC